MNNQNSILLIDPAFEPSDSLNCSLLLKVGIDSFSYVIINKEMNKIQAIYDEQECVNGAKKLNERLKNDTYLGLTFTEIKLAFYTENMISVPNVLQNIETNKLFFRQGSENLYTTSHPNFGFTSMFSFSKVTDEIINQFFAKSKKYHIGATLLKLAENVTDRALIFDFTVGSIQVLYINSKQVIFQQCYEIENVEEFNYYLLLMINQLTINPSETTIYVSGIIHVDDDKFNCLEHYFNVIHFLNFVDFNLDQQLLEDMPSHYYTTLLTLDQCV